MRSAARGMIRGAHVRIALGILLPLVWLALIRYSALPGGENDTDPYYHVALADQGPAFYMQKTFPQARLSVWHQAFSDKELGFHLLLTLLRRTESLLGLSALPPFHVPWLFFALLFLGAFVFVLRSFGADPLLPSCLLVLLCPLFTHRLLMLRPHVLSMTIMVLSCWIFWRLRGAGDLWKPAALGFVYSWSYSSPHFLLLPTAVFGAAHLRARRRLGILLPLVTILGLVAGYVLHPQFPHTFTNWKIQAIDVIAAVRSEQTLPLAFGRELLPPDPAMLRRSAALFVRALANILGLLLLKRKGPAIPPALPPLVLLSAISTGALLFGLRAMEYAMPFTVLAGALLIAAHNKVMIRRQDTSRFIPSLHSTTEQFQPNLPAGERFPERVACERRPPPRSHPRDRA